MKFEKPGLGQLILIAELILAAALVILLFKIVFIFIKPGGTQAIAPKTVSGIETSAIPAKIDPSILTEFDVFHRDKTEIAIIQTNSAPETTLDLKVYGIRADGAGESSSAIIETPDGKQAVFLIGGEIIPGVSLKSVDVDFVILDRNGTPERLSLQGRSEEDKASMVTIAASTLSFGAAEMIKDVRFYPHREGKTVIGFRVLPQRGSAKKLEQYGFKRGDIITSINGEDLTQQQVNMPNLFKNLKLARYANIQIIRDDVPMTIEVNLK